MICLVLVMLTLTLKFTVNLGSVLLDFLCPEFMVAHTRNDVIMHQLLNV